MFKINSNMHIFVAGRTQEGKSTLVRSFVNMYPRICIHDRKFEWQNFAKRNHYYLVNTPEHLQMLLNKGAKRIVYQPSDPSVDDFDLVCKVIYDLGNIAFLVDEVASYIKTSQINFWASEILRLGAGRGVSFISITQRPRDVANVLLSESSIIISFRLLLKTDRTKLAETCGRVIDPKLPDDPVAASKIKSIATMPKFHFMIFDSLSGEVTWHTPIPVKQTNQNL